MSYNDLDSSISISTIQNVMQGSVTIEYSEFSGSFYLTLDTLPPQNVSLGTDIATNNTLTTCTIATGDVDTTGYQMKLWGDVDLGYDVNVQDTEQNSSWIAFNPSFNVTLSGTIGDRDLYLKIRDDVGNESAVANSPIILDTIKPISTITNVPLAPKLSAQPGYNNVSSTWINDETFYEYSVRVVPTPESPYEDGIQIPTTNGSQNVQGVGTFESNSGIITRIEVDDLKLIADDGIITVKFFTKDIAGNWVE